MKKIVGIGMLAALIAVGVFSVSEASPSGNDGYCCNGDYCYRQNYNNKSDNSREYCGEYCCNGRHGCW